MNIFKELFSIVQGKGVVERIKKNESIVLFLLMGFVIICIGCGLYGYAMGIGTSPVSAWKDMVKIVMIFILSYIISLLPSLVIFKLIYPKLHTKAVAVGLFSGFLMSSLILGMCAPFSFLYGLIWNIGGKLVHIVLIDLAIVIGLYLSGTAIWYIVEGDKHKLALPLIITFLFVLLAIYLLAYFFSPYFTDTSFFCEGIRRLQEIFKGKYLTV